VSEYDTDILLWSEHQAALLRRLAAGERVNDQVDWANVVEEIESVGNEQLHAVESLLVQALRHMLKAEAWPHHRDAPGWRADAIDCRQQAQRRFAPSMRQKLDMERIWRHALRAIPRTVDEQDPLPLPEVCPYTLEELLE
jgi:hypothetical protein